MSLHPLLRGLLLTCLAPGIQAQNTEYARRPITAFACPNAPTIDGDLSDAIWMSAPKAEVFVDRETNKPAPDQTVAMLAFDSKYIYVAFRCTDSEPDKVEARETVRDSKYNNLNNGESPNKEDNVTFTIDPYFTKKADDLSTFSVNALGTPSAIIAGGRGGKLEWKGAWDSAAKRTDNGYSVEMRIPWEMLNYPASKDPVTMGVNFYRYQYHRRQESVWSNVTRHSLVDLEGVCSGVLVPQSAFKPKLSLLPYVLPGVRDGGLIFRSGVDARLTVTPELTAVATLNPDFNTIEGAIESIAFSRRERFIPDRRPFFLEGEDYYFPGTRFNDIGAFFYARRIESFDFGTKVYGKVTPKDSVGFLNTVTFGKRMDTALRYKHDLSDKSDVGLYIGNLSTTGFDNTVLMVDQHARIGPFGVESQFAKTWGEGTNGGAAVLSTYYQKNNNITLLQYHNISDRFIIANGFIPNIDYRGFYGFTDWFGQWRKGPWQSYDYGVYGILWDHQDGSIYNRGFGSFGTLVSKRDWSIGLEQDYSTFEGTIDSTYGVRYTSGVSNRFRRFGARLSTGVLVSEPSTFIAPFASFRLFKGLDIGYSGSLLNFQGHTNQHTVTLGYELSPTRSFGGRVVSQDGETNWYLAYRSAGLRGTDFYAILGDPNARRFQRVFQLKFVFSF